jgi:hypothetical protein
LCSVFSVSPCCRTTRFSKHCCTCLERNDQWFVVVKSCTRLCNTLHAWRSTAITHVPRYPLQSLPSLSLLHSLSLTPNRTALRRPPHLMRPLRPVRRRFPQRSLLPGGCPSARGSSASTTSAMPTPIDPTVMSVLNRSFPMAAGLACSSREMGVPPGFVPFPWHATPRAGQPLASEPSSTTTVAPHVTAQPPPPSLGSLSLLPIVSFLFPCFRFW